MHLSLAHENEIDSVDWVLRAYPEAAAEPDINGDLPVHLGRRPCLFSFFFLCVCVCDVSALARAERGGGLTAWTRYRAVAALLEGSGAGMPAAAQATNAADKADIWKGGILCA